MFVFVLVSQTFAFSFFLLFFHPSYNLKNFSSVRLVQVGGSFRVCQLDLLAWLAPSSILVVRALNKFCS